MSSGKGEAVEEFAKKNKNTLLVTKLLEKIVGTLRKTVRKEVFGYFAAIIYYSTPTSPIPLPNHSNGWPIA